MRTQTEREFRKQLKRDFLVMMAVSAVVAIGIVLTLYYSVKHGW